MCSRAANEIDNEQSWSARLDHSDVDMLLSQSPALLTFRGSTSRATAR